MLTHARWTTIRIMENLFGMERTLEHLNAGVSVSFVWQSGYTRSYGNLLLQTEDDTQKPTSAITTRKHQGV